MPCHAPGAFAVALALATGPAWSAGEPRGLRGEPRGEAADGSAAPETAWTSPSGAVSSLLTRALRVPSLCLADLDGSLRGKLGLFAAPQRPDARRLFAVPMSPGLTRGSSEPSKTSYTSHFTPHLEPRTARNRNVAPANIWPVVVKQGDIKVVERLGKFKKELSPGFHWIIPYADHVRATVTEREQVFDIPPQRCVTSDNAPIEADAVVYWRIFNAQLATYSVVDLELAIQNLVLTQLRAEIGKLTLQETFSARERINEVLLEDLHVATDPWGVKITRVEVRDIIPDPEIMKAMEMEVAAERTKRALIIKSEGERMRAINEAEGAAQSRIIEANSTADAIRVQGLAEADALTMSAHALGGPDAAARYKLLKAYMDAQRDLAKSDNAKVIFSTGAEDSFAKALAYYDATRDP